MGVVSVTLRGALLKNKDVPHAQEAAIQLNAPGRTRRNGQKLIKMPCVMQNNRA